MISSWSATWFSRRYSGPFDAKRSRHAVQFLLSLAQVVVDVHESELMISIGEQPGANKLLNNKLWEAWNATAKMHGLLHNPFAWEKPPEAGIIQDLTSKNADFFGGHGENQTGMVG
jgi:hypothetical protein